MAIRFACQCGKNLKAADTMGGRGTMCPACHSPVRIPKSVRSPAGVTGAERPGELGTRTGVLETPVGAVLCAPRPARRADRSRRPAPQPLDFSDPDSIRITLRRRPNWMKLVTQPGEPAWYDGLTYPYPKVPVFIRLAAMLTVLTACAFVAWLALSEGGRDGWPRPVLGFCLVGVLLGLGYTCNYLDSLVTLAARGAAKFEPGMDPHPGRALLSCARWLACFLSGPAMLAGAAVGYWMYCGDLTMLDWLILSELAITTAGWWLIAVVVSSAHDDVWLPSPRRVLLTALGMKWAAAKLTLLAAGVVLVHLFVAMLAVSQFHAQPLLGFALLCICWTSGLYLSAYTFRRLGLAVRLPCDRAVRFSEGQIVTDSAPEVRNF